MAEFQEVMREWTRMCNAVPGKAEYRSLCSDKKSGYVCPLRKNGLCNRSIAEQTNEDWAEGEHIIMSWAAEHPEPVYPTWATWLTDQGVLVCDESYPNTRYWYAINKQKIEQPIPADIAERLGIEPKEA